MTGGYVKYKIPFIKPHFPDANDLVKDFCEICENNWFTNFGPFEKELCLQISNLYHDESHVTTIANATLGIQAAVDVLMNNKSDKLDVLIPSFTFAAGPEVLIRSGFRPVFMDIDKSNWQPSFEQACAYLDKNHRKVGGILLCNIFGVGNADVGKWELLASNYKLPLIIDSAAGFGSSYTENEKIGLHGDCEIFSMHATKPFSVGEGGLIISRSPSLIKRIRDYQNFGFDDNRNISTLGTNAKLQELSCAIGLRQLDDFNRRLTLRRQTLFLYKKYLEPIGFEFMENDSLSAVCFASLLAPSSEQAIDIERELITNGVEVKRYYSPLHFQKAISEYSTLAGSMKITENVYSRILSLPVHDEMSEADVLYITGIIIRAIK